MHYVYVIQNDVSKETYIGYTTHLKERLRAHNARGKKHTTRTAGEWHIVYVKIYRAESDARNREKRLKQHGSSKHNLFTRLTRSLL
jgi:predicted GIY-YIG superfamily endonuclease